MDYQTLFTGLAALGTVLAVVVSLWAFRRGDRRNREQDAKDIIEWRKTIEHQTDANASSQRRHEEECAEARREDKEWKLRFEQKFDQQAERHDKHVDDRFDQLTQRMDGMMQPRT